MTEPPRSPDDRPDERMRAMLEVDPLDELARRRLVDGALRASAPARSGRRLAAAVLIVAVLAGGAALFAGLRTGPAATPTAAPRSAGIAPAQGDTTTVPPGDAGDFGDLGVPANLARLKDALGRLAPEKSAARAEQGSATPQTPGPRVAGLTTRLRALGCAGSLPAGTTVALATGTVGGRPAIVVQTLTPDGRTVASVVLDDPCEVRPLT